MTGKHHVQIRTSNKALAPICVPSVAATTPRFRSLRQVENKLEKLAKQVGNLSKRKSQTQLEIEGSTNYIQ